MGTRTGWTRRIAVVALVTAALVLGVAATAFAATPTQPVIKDVWVTKVSGVSKITVQWYASTDASATHVVSYDIYRDVIPVTAATITSRSLTPVITGFSGTTAQVNASAAEVSQSYVWFYAVVAKDDQVPANKSVPSLNMSANLHGYRFDTNLIACTRCHSAHGVYKIHYSEKGSCYACHGGTGRDAATGAKSTLNTEASFYDTGTLTPGSRHRNQYMTDTKQECTACHTPHRSPYYYNASGVYDAASSYRRMLRVEYSTNAFAYYSRASVPAQANEFCFSCHGSTAVTWDGKTINAETAMGIVGGTTAYGNAGGDHNYAGYATSAHGTGVIYSNDYDGSTATTDNPAVQCEACHNNHASATDKLIDYRSSETTNATRWAQANLCYGCHSAASTETSVNTGVTTKPFAWNSRDVKAQFVKRSHHPTTPTSSGVYVATHHDTWSDTTAAEFNTYTSTGVQVTDVSGGEIILSGTDLPAEPWIYQNVGNTVFDGYDINAAAWNSGFNPTDHNAAPANFSAGLGSSSFWVNNKVYTSQGGGTAHWVYDPASNAWAAAPAGPNGTFTVGDAGDTAVNTRSDSTCVYYSRGGNSSGMYWWDYTGTTTGTFGFRQGGAARALGVGSAIAFAPTANRLFAIYQNGVNGDGGLYYRATPGQNPNNTTDWAAADTTVMNDTDTMYNRMTYFVQNGTEYLLLIGSDVGRAQETLLVYNLSTTPTVVEFGNIGAFGTTALSGGCDLEWDGGRYIYAVKGGATSSPNMRRIQIPAAGVDPKVPANWGSWTDVTPNGTWAANSSIAIGTYDPPATYGTSGNSVTGDILPYAQAHHWGRVTWTESEAPSTDCSVTAQGWNGASWATLGSTTDASPIDLSTYTTAAYSKLRLRVNLATSNTANTPTLYDWAVTSIFDQWAPDAGTLTCVNCHNVHSVTRGATVTSPWQMDRVSDPKNTKYNYPGTPTAFCLECHDGATSEATITASALVPYTAGFRSITAPFFPGWNKTATGASFSSSGHGSTTIQQLSGQIGCQSCHDPHASDNERLTALTASGGNTSAGHLNVARVNTTAYSEEDLCYGCHDARRSGSCSAAGCHNTSMTFLDVKTSFSSTYAHPVGIDGRHTDTETATGLGSAKRHAECADCHDAHAAQYGTHTESGSKTSKAGDVLLGSIGVNPNYGTASDANNWTAPAVAGYTVTRANGDATDYEAYLCFKCHSAYSGQPFSVTTTSGAYTSTDLALEFNPSNFSEHNVLGQSVAMDNSFLVGGTPYSWVKPADSAFLKSGWTSDSPMTCTDCHSGSQTEAKGPHGSAVIWLLDEGYTNWTDTTTLSNATVSGISSDTVICAKCHTDLDATNWVHSNHRGWPDGGGNRCQMCHPKVPHGSKKPRLLGSDQATGLKMVKAKTITNLTSAWNTSDCQASCYGSHNNAVTAPYYP